MTDETNATAPADGEDTAAVLAQAGGDKTYVGEPKAEEPEETPEEEPGEDAAAAAGEGDAKPAKPKQTAQERIDEAIRQKHEIGREKDREIEFWKAKATQTTQPAPIAATADASERPSPEKYEGGVYDPQYLEDLTDWKAERAVEKRFAQRETETRVKTAVQTFDERAAKLFPDGEPEGLIAVRNMNSFPQALTETILASEIGPKLADHLGSNPRELSRLSALPPHLQAYEIGKLEQKLAGPPVIPPKTATDAPEPAPTLRGNGGRFKVAGDTSDFAAFEAQYKLGG